MFSVTRKKLGKIIINLLLLSLRLLLDGRYSLKNWEQFVLNCLVFSIFLILPNRHMGQ